MCVIGAGTMGAGIAQVAAQAGIRVQLIDTTESALAAGRGRLEASLAGGIERGKIGAAQADEVRRLIAWDLVSTPPSRADWVIEAVPEDAGTKAGVLRSISGFFDEATPIATNTSTLRISSLAASCEAPARFLGMHFFNPVPAMKLVEIIPGENTAGEVTGRAVALCERLGKTPVVAPDIPGFIVNRAFAALVSAAIGVWAAGATPASVDESIELGLAHKMGPLRSADLVGLDVMLAVLRSLHAETGDGRFEPPAGLVALVEGGKLGRKSGEGFYTYPEQR
jgi:3-hydroxybutyryl-CoA dehydrogenase